MKVKSESEVAQPCPTLCDLMDCSLPGFSVHGILQARVLEWVAIAFSDTSATTPKMINYLLNKRKTISWAGCLTQLFVEHLLGGSEIIILIVMAYDCYLAICKPLHYMTIMKQGLCQLLVVVAWIGGDPTCHHADSFHDKLDLLWTQSH